jgi:hypothetical protein
MIKTKIKTVNFVDATDVFDGCRTAWSLFLEAGPDCSFGNNNRTLVTADTIIDALHECDEHPEVDTVLERLNELGEDFYVDLEN